MDIEKNTPAIIIRAYTPEQVAEMLQEPVHTVVVHCRTHALEGA